MRPSQNQTRYSGQQTSAPHYRYRNNFERPPLQPSANSNINFQRNVEAQQTNEHRLAYSQNFSNQPFTRPLINFPKYSLHVRPEYVNYQTTQFQQAVPPQHDIFPCSFSNISGHFETSFDSQSVINNWLSANTDVDQQNRKLQDPAIKVSKVSENLRMCYKNVIEIEQYVQYLESNMYTLVDEKWKEIRKYVNQKKELIEKYQKAVDLRGNDLHEFLSVIRKRKAKRKRLKNAKQEKLKEVPIYFLDAELELIEKEKQEIEMKKQAMALLTSVKKKKIESRRQIKRLSAMIKLHDARNMNLARKADGGFKIIIGKLIKMWEDQLKESRLEETGLKVMLQDEPSGNRIQKGSNSKQDYGRWLRAIFGIVNDRSHILYSNEREFVDIRVQWDKYVTPENTTSSSKIPAGWVLPDVQASEPWKKYLCSDNNYY